MSTKAGELQPTRSEWFANLWFESRFLLLAVPPIALLAVLRLATVSLEDSVRVVIFAESLSLSLWTGLAAWLAGLPRRSIVLAVLAGLVVGSVVVALQVVLQPGRAVEGGVAAGPRSSLVSSRN